MAIYGWKLADDSGNPVAEQNWNTPASWIAYPVANPPVTGKVPASGDQAFIGAGTAFINPNPFAVTVDVTDGRTVATLGLGGMAITGVNLFPTISPQLGTPTVFPTVKVTGGTLDVTGNLVGSFTGTIAIPINGLGTEQFSGTFNGGGTVDLASKGTLEVGGTVDPTIKVDFTDGASDLLQLGGVTSAAPLAFGGTIDDFKQGDTILLTGLHTTTHFIPTYNGGVLTIADSAAPLTQVASLQLPGAFTSVSFALSAGTGGLAITLAPPGVPVASTPDLSAASDSGRSNTDNITNLTTPTFTGTAEASATVDLFDGTTVVGTATASGAGAWSITSSALASGLHSITAKTIDTHGTSAASGALSVTIDTTPPAAPSTPDLAAASDSGISNADNITNVTTPTFTGTAEASAAITLMDGATAIGSAIADGTGAWSIKSSALVAGKHSIAAKAIDVAGNVGLASAALSVTIDTTAPAVPSVPDLTAASDDGVSNTDNQTSVTTPVFAGTAEAGSTVTLLDAGKSVGTAVADSTGAWSIKSSALAVGAHSISAKATDVAGNVGPTSAALPVTILATHDVHWVAGSGSFDTIADWSPQRVPNSTDNAFIDAAGSYTVTAAASESIKTLAVTKTATLSITGGTFAVSGGSGTGGLAGIVNVADGAILALAGAVVNSGTINENAGADFTELQLTGASATLSGKGFVNLSNSANNLVLGSSSTTVLTNLDNTIAGAGTIGVGQMMLVNDAVINANKATSLVIDTGSNVVTNAGTLEATAVGGLRLNSTVNNTVGTINAAGAGAVVSFANSIMGGKLVSSGGGVIKTVGGSAALDGQGLHPVTNTGTVQVADGTGLSLLGSITNSGTIVLASTGDGTTLQIASPQVTLSGKGKIVLAGTGASSIAGTAAGFALTNVDNTISGAGQINVPLTNSGTVSADQATPLVLFGALSNTATMQAVGKGGLVLQNATVVNAGGTIQATVAGSHVDLGSSTVMGGLLHTAAGGVIDTVGGGTLDGVSDGALTSDGTILVKDNETLTLLGTISNSGTISEQAVAGSSDIHLGSATVTLTGGGKVTLSNNVNNHIDVSTPTQRLVNVNNTISGAGQIGGGNMRLTNQAAGVINANQASSAANPDWLVLNTGPSVITNAGLMEATNTGGLVLQSPVKNVGGTILASGAGAHVDLSSTSIIGGTLSGASGGLVNVIAPSGTLDGLSAGALTNAATVVVEDGANVTLLGTIANTGRIADAATASNAAIIVGGPGTTLSGKGTVVLTNNAGNVIVGSNPFSELLNVDNTISGAGQFGGGSSLALTNEAGGTINANQALALTLNSTSAVTNAGLIEATDTAAGNGGFVIQNTSIDNAGGAIQAVGANSHVDLSGGIIVGGMLKSSGGGAIQIAAGNGVLDGLDDGALTNSGVVKVTNGSILELLGTINNTGSILLNATTANTDLQIGLPTVTLTGGGVVSLSNNAGNRIYGAAPASRLVNVNNTISGAGQFGSGQLRLTNQVAGVINANQAASKTNPGSLVLNTGQVIITNAGLMEATNTGGLVLQSSVKNVGGTILASGAGAHVDLSSASIIGGALGGASGGVVDVIAPSGTLDGLSAGSLTNAATVVVEDAASLVLLGTIGNIGRISDAATASSATILVGGSATTLSGKGTVVLTNNAGNSIVASNFLSELVNVDNTISGAGQLGAGSSLALTNEAGGTINANQAIALTLNSSSDVANMGLIEATDTAAGNGGFVVQNTSIDNAGGTIQAVGANSHIDLAGGTIVGGTLKSSGGGAIQTAAGTSGVLDGLHDGALTNSGTVKVTDSTTLDLLGTINNTGSILLNATTANNTDLQVGSPTVTLTGGGVVTLSNNTGNRIYGVVASNRLVNMNNTIAGAGQLGAGQLGLTNTGTINANAAKGLVIDLGGQTGLNQGKGLIEGSAAGGLSIASGIFSNSGTVLATNASKVTFQPAAVVANNASGVLGGGVWEASGNGSTLSITGGAVTVDHATVVLSGAGSVFRAGDGTTFTTLEQSLVTIVGGGALDVLASRAYTTGKAIADNGTIQLGGGTLTAAGLSIGAGAHLTGFGVVATTSKTIADAGTIEANGGTLSTASVISGAGVLQADAGATLVLSGVGDKNASVVNNGTVTLAASASLDVTGSIGAASTGVFQLNASSLLEIAADQGAGDKMSFLGTGELMIDAAAKFGLNVGQATYTGPLLQHFVAGDQVQLNDIAPTGLTPNYNTTTGLLQLNNGSANVASLMFDPATLGAGAFHVANVGGHTVLTHS